MRRRSVLIVDDKESCVALLEAHIARLPFFCPPVVVGTVGSALNLLLEEEFDIVFLDIILPDLAGLDVLKALPRQSPIVITTADPSFAAECYDLNISDYLVKPHSFQRFIRSVNRALGVQFTTHTLADNQSIYLKVGRTIQRFDYEAIDLIEAYGIYTKIWYNQKAIVVNETISALEARLPVDIFMRIHKSYIVNLPKVTSYTHANLWIEATKVPIGALHRTKFEGFFHLLDKPQFDD